jgi:hypothetical protein
MVERTRPEVEVWGCRRKCKGRTKDPVPEGWQAFGEFANLVNVSPSLKLANVAKQDSFTYASDAH